MSLLDSHEPPGWTVPGASFILTLKNRKVGTELISDFSLFSLLYFDQCGRLGLGFIESFSSSWQWASQPGLCKSWALLPAQRPTLLTMA